MSLSKIFKTDSALEQKGTPITFPENDDGTVPTFYIARMHETNVKYKKALEVATRPYRRELQLGTMPDNKAKDISMAVFAETILTGWENIPVEDLGMTPTTENEKAAFTKENVKLLMDNLPDLYSELQSQARNMANFLAAQREDETKN